MKILMTFVILFVFSTQAYSYEYKVYFNDRFGYQIQYPDFMREQGEAANGDGQKITGRSAELTVWGSYAPQDIDELYKYANDDLKGYKITYFTKKSDSFTISGYDKHQVAYFKSIFHCNSNINLRLFYPMKDKKIWDIIVKQISKSFVFSSKSCSY